MNTIEMVNIKQTKIFEKFKSLPLSTQRMTGLGVVLLMIITLPVFIWAVITQRLLITKHAASGEPGVCIAYNNTIIVTPNTDTDGQCHDIQTAVNSAPDGTTILIQPGDYNITNTIYINNKHGLTIEGNVEGSVDAAWLSFNTTNSGGYGIKVENSSGSIKRLHLEGVTPNGLLSIQNSTNFGVYFTKLYGTSSHTLDIQNSSEIEIGDSEILSSAGAIEIDMSHNININYNRIHNSSTGVRASNSTYVMIMNNLITANNGGAIYIWNVPNTGIYHNTIVNNTGSSATVDFSGNNPLSTFSQNIVAFNVGPGVVKEGNTTNFATFSYNDVFANYAGYNYSGMTDPTGTNGNISQDPALNQSYGYYCLFNGSPALYGNVNSREYMGHAGPCSTSTPIPNPSPVGQVPPGISDSPFSGPVDAPITIIEFTDFQCPFCKTFNDQTFGQLMNEYPNKIRFIVKEFPLSQIHPQAFVAAEAAECANEQNKFWPMHDMLFAHQDLFATNPFSGFAQQLGLNVTQFNNCMSTHKYGPTINQDLADGYANGANGTPTFLINGTLLQGAQPLSAFKNIIDSILPSPSPIAGDVNADGHVNIVDIGIIIDNYRASPLLDPRADLSGDGVVNIVDIGIVVDNYQF